MAVLNKRAIVMAIEMYGVTAIRLGRTLNPALDVLIKALFTSGEQGFAYDPNDLTTLYQDAAGSIPVTGAGQPVGLMRDKSGRNNHAFQTVSASRPILQRNATTGAYYLAFDGADDFLQTNNIDFTATDKVTVIYAAKRVLESATGTVIELSPAAYSNNKSFGVFSPATNGGKNTGATLRTDTSYYLVNTKQDNTFVSTFKTEIGSGNSSVTTNKQAFNQSTTPFAGTFGNYPVYIGRREGKFLPFGGQIYALLVIGKLLDDATTQRIEKEFVKYIGVTLNV